MAENESNDRLSGLLVELSRSLLQYAGESWPWSDAKQSEQRHVVDQLISRQRVQIGRLAELIASRQRIVEFGTYPTNYTDFHYVGLDCILRKLVENESAIVASLDEALIAASQDEEAVGLLGQIVDIERDSLNQLKSLLNSE